MAEEQAKEEYKSPMRKLVTFFEKSRDRWKSKFMESKKVVKRLQNRIKFLEESKSKWKERAKELQAENDRLTAQFEKMKVEPEAQDDVKKTS